jgi:predicted NodU family carbamoyl transferase
MAWMTPISTDKGAACGASIMQLRRHELENVVDYLKMKTVSTFILNYT